MRIWALALALALVLMLASSSEIGQAAATRIPALDGPYLFLDTTLVDTALTRNIVLVPQPAEIRQRVIAPDKPWEAMGYHYWTTLLEDDAGYRIYYRRRTVSDSEQSEGLFCVAVSTDGINWTKPELGYVVEDDRDTNCTAYGFQFVFVDPNAPPEERYKKFGHLDDLSFGITGVSDDGLRFVKTQRQLLPFHVDTQNVVLWDDVLKRYVFYLRGWDTELGRQVLRAEAAGLDEPIPFVAATVKAPLQRKTSSETPDFLGDEFPVVLAPDSQDWENWQAPGKGMVDIYHSAAFKYPWARNVYLAFPNIYYHYTSQTLPPALKANDGEFQAHLAVSRDSSVWTHYHQPYVDRASIDGLDIKMVSMGQGMVRRGDELFQYLIALPRSHANGAYIDGVWRSIDESDETRQKWMASDRGGIYLAVQRLHGFVAAEATMPVGTLVTRPFVFHGNGLLLNLKTGSKGSVCVGLTDAKGVDIPGRGLADCDPLQELDSVAHQVTWGTDGDLSAHSGREVRLKFAISDAKVYSFEFTGDAYHGPALGVVWGESFTNGFGKLDHQVGPGVWRVEAGKLIGEFGRDGMLKERTGLLPHPLTEKDAFAVQVDFRIHSGARTPDSEAYVGLMGDGSVSPNPFLMIWIDNGGLQWGIKGNLDGATNRFGLTSRVKPDLSLWPYAGATFRARMVWDPQTRVATLRMTDLTHGWNLGSTSVSITDGPFTLDRIGVRADGSSRAGKLVLEMDKLRLEAVAPVQSTPTPTATSTFTVTPTSTAQPSPTSTPSPTPTRVITHIYFPTWLNLR